MHFPKEWRYCECYLLKIQSNLYKTTTLGTIQKWYVHFERTYIKKRGWLFHYNTGTKAKSITFLSKQDFLLRIIQFWRPKPIPPPPPTHPHPQKWTINLLFKNNRICKHVTCPPPNFKTSPPPLPTDVIDAWTLIRSIFQKCERRDRILRSFISLIKA